VENLLEILKKKASLDSKDKLTLGTKQSILNRQLQEWYKKMKGQSWPKRKDRTAQNVPTGLNHKAWVSLASTWPLVRCPARVPLLFFIRPSLFISLFARKSVNF
jgi:hypothetical protein